MIIDKYISRLKDTENRFYEYEKALDSIIQTISEKTDHTVITKGAITNFTPYYEERLGDKLNGIILDSPIISDDCMKYHYDNENRIIMVEEYSAFLGKFCITEIYLYGKETEKLWLSCGILSRLFVFDNPFGNTSLC